MPSVIHEDLKTYKRNPHSNINPSVIIENFDIAILSTMVTDYDRPSIIHGSACGVFFMASALMLGDGQRP
jgi:hypothetical protein